MNVQKTLGPVIIDSPLSKIAEEIEKEKEVMG